MAKKEIFQASLNNMLEKIRLDATDCFDNPPEQQYADYDLQDLEDKAIEYHTKGETGTYLYFMCLHEMKSIELRIAKEKEDKEKEKKK